MINNKRIILCLDIDETIMNSSTPMPLIDINGSDNYGDASAWVNFLTEMKAYCESRSFQFFIQIITAKSRVDYPILHVFNALHSFLPPLNKSSDVIKMGGMDTSKQFHYMQHENMTHHLVSVTHVNEQMKITDQDLPLADTELLPSIHLCRYNLVNRYDACDPSISDYSKALVMKRIAEHFHEITPAENMFLLDDQLGNISEIEESPYGYKGLSANTLWQLSKGTKKERTRECHTILTAARRKIEARVDFILDNDDVVVNKNTNDKITGSNSPYGLFNTQYRASDNDHSDVLDNHHFYIASSQQH